MAGSFRDLTVWQRAMELAVSVYKLTQGFPREEIYGLTSQIRRSAVSIPSNIAEGQDRASPGEFKHFLSIARGSNCEVQTQVEIARKLSLGEPKLIDEAESLSNEVRMMLFGLIDSMGREKNWRLRTPIGELRTVN